MTINTEEYLDITDEHGNLLGKTELRSIAHRDMLWHRTSHIWIVNSKREILCQKRSILKDSNPGKWQSYFGWHVTAGQTFEENAISELEEEVGVRISPKDLHFVRSWKSESAHHHSKKYVIFLDREISEFSCQDGEVDELEWISIEKLESEIEKRGFCSKLDFVVVDFVQNFPNS